MIRKGTLLLLLAVAGFSWKSNAQCPPNIDFEFGNFTNWSCYTGLYTGPGTLAITTPTPPITGRHTIMTGAGLDPICGFPIVDLGGGNYTARLGTNAPLNLDERIRYYIDVPSGSATYALVYKFAIVLEAPSGHSVSQMPRFDVAASDSVTGLPVPCGAYDYISAAGGLPGFVTAPGTDCLYRPWNTATLNLSGLGGTTVAIDFSAYDCALGGHFGYAYVDMTCGLFQVQGITCNDTATHVTLSGPFGYEYYTWYDSATFTTIYGDSQTITISVPGGPITIALVLGPYVGFGCADTLYTHLSPSNLQLHPMRDTTICAGDSITIYSGATDIAIPLSYNWSGPGLACVTCATPVVHPPGSGTFTYSVAVTNTVGCTRDTFMTVTIDNLSAAFSKFDDTCHRGNTGWAKATVLSGIGPFSYFWNTVPPQTTATATGLAGDGAGTWPTAHLTYTVTVSDGLGCQIKQPIDIYDGRPTDLYVVNSTNPDSCDIHNGFIVLDSLLPGQTFTITYLYNGLPRSQTLTANALWQVTLDTLGRGTYTDIAVVTAHCPYNIIVGPVILSDPPQPSVPAMSSNSPICVGIPLSLSATSNPGVIYKWEYPSGDSIFGATQTVAPTNFSDSGVYTVVVNRTNCFDSNKIRVNINPQPFAGAGSNSAICSGSTLNLTSTSTVPGSLFIWNGPNAFYSTTQNPSIGNAQTNASGIYTVTAVKNGCSGPNTVTVVVNQTPGAPAVQDTEICQKSVASQMVAFADAGNSLNWYNSASGGTASGMAPTPSTLKEGVDSFYVSQISTAGCEGPRALITAQVDYLASPSIEITDTVICRQNDIQFSAINTGDDITGIMWSFSDGHSLDNANPILHSFTGTGVYTVTATALYKVCPEETVSRTVRIFAALNVYLGNDTTICPGGEAIVLNDNTNSSTNGASWKWNTGETTPQIRVTTPGTYYVKATIDGCSATDTIVIAKDCYLDIPNVFTPNNDGMNDYFFPRQLLTRGMTAFSMAIYNRWGQEIFSSTSLDGRGWDGKFNDAPQPEGVYVYIIDVTFKDGQKEHHQGNVTLLR